MAKLTSHCWVLSSKWDIYINPLSQGNIIEKGTENMEEGGWEEESYEMLSSELNRDIITSMNLASTVTYNGQCKIEPGHFPA